MELDDPRWPVLVGGYGVFYDPRKALDILEHGADTSAAWQELWNELYHQGDIGDASYAAVPHIVRIYAARQLSAADTYMLVATIEEARHRGHNPHGPSALLEEYDNALRQLLAMGLRELTSANDPDLVSSIIALVAFEKRQLALGRFALKFRERERTGMIETAGWVD